MSTTKTRRKWSRRTGTCVICESQNVLVRENRKSGQDVCRPCYRKHVTPAKKVKCDICGNKRTVSRREKNVGAICGSCNRTLYHINTKVCYLCGQEKPVQKNTTKGPVCALCCDKFLYQRPLRRCSRCRKIRPRVMRVGRGGLCRLCYQRANRHRYFFTCGFCGRHNVYIVTYRERKCVCKSCYGKMRRAERHKAKTDQPAATPTNNS